MVARSPPQYTESICLVCFSEKRNSVSCVFLPLGRGLSPLRNSSCIEMHEAVARTSSVGLELACVDGMRLGKAVGQGQSFSFHTLGGGSISPLSKEFDQKSWGTYELRRNVTFFTSSLSDDQT